MLRCSKQNALIVGVGLLIICSILLTQTLHAAAADKPILLRYAGTMPVGHIITTGMEKWASLVQERTSGVKMQLFPAGQLYKTEDYPRALPGGEVDLAQVVADTVGGLVKTTEVMNFGMMFADWTSALETINAGWDIFQADFEKKNMHLIFLMPYGETVMPMTTKKQVRTLEDMKGLKIRGMAGRPDRALELCGATPVYISSAEVFTAMQLGTIDGAMSGWSTYYKRGWHEVGKYIINIPYSFTFFMTVANLDAWRRLPEDVQKTMVETGKEVSTSMLELAQKEDEAFIQKLTQAGVKIYTPPPEEMGRWRQRVLPMWEEWGAQNPMHARLLEMAKKRSR